MNPAGRVAKFVPDQRLGTVPDHCSGTFHVKSRGIQFMREAQFMHHEWIFSYGAIHDCVAVNSSLSHPHFNLGSTPLALNPLIKLSLE